MNRDINNTDEQNHIKLQNDLIRLIKLLDECSENLDLLYYSIRKKELLDLSNDN
jgi:hypothetical protein